MSIQEFDPVHVLMSVNVVALILLVWGAGRRRSKDETAALRLKVATREQELHVLEKEVQRLRYERSKLLTRLIEARVVPPWADNAFGPVQPPPKDST